RRRRSLLPKSRSQNAPACLSRLRNAGASSPQALAYMDGEKRPGGLSRLSCCWHIERANRYRRAPKVAELCCLPCSLEAWCPVSFLMEPANPLYNISHEKEATFAATTGRANDDQARGLSARDARNQSAICACGLREHRQARTVA